MKDSVRQASPWQGIVFGLLSVGMGLFVLLAAATLPMTGQSADS